MNQDLEKYLNAFDLKPHPEGGYFKEIYRSEEQIPKGVFSEFDDNRNVCTGIYYLLSEKDKSHFHRIKSDEIWHFYKGTSNVNIHCIMKDGTYKLIKVGDNKDCLNFQIVIPKGVWFAAELEENNEGNYALCGCTVAPGFDFKDFEMAKKSELLQKYPLHKNIIEIFTLE